MFTCVDVCCFCFSFGSQVRWYLITFDGRGRYIGYTLRPSVVVDSTMMRVQL